MCHVRPVNHPYTGSHARDRPDKPVGTTGRRRSVRLTPDMCGSYTTDLLSYPAAAKAFPDLPLSYPYLLTRFNCFLVCIACDVLMGPGV